MKFVNLVDPMKDTNLVDELKNTIETCGLPLKLDDITGGDGNCWVRGVVQQLERTEIQIQPNIRTMEVLDGIREESYLRLKKEISKFMTSSQHPTIQTAKTEFEESIGLTDDISWEDFWEKMEKDGE